MTTINDRSRGAEESRGSGTVAIGVMLGLLAAVVIGMFVFVNAFDRTPAATNLTMAPSSPAIPTQ